ncbi:MAG: glycosyltransferase family 2 protein [Pseudomonadota bacterium]
MKICTLIPATKTKYLPELLFSLSRQTIKPARIIFSDNSPNGEYTAALKAVEIQPALAGLGVEVELIPGPRMGWISNVRNLLSAWNGSTELAHLFLDDDFIYPTFYQRHLQTWAGGGTFACTVSQRWTAIESGQPTGLLPLPHQVVQHAGRALSIPASVAYATTIPVAANWFGEFSNMIFDHKLLMAMQDFLLADISYDGLEDIGTCLKLVQQHPLCYLNEPLGFFRLNPYQNTQQTMSQVRKMTYVAWLALAIAGRRLGFIQPRQVFECSRRIGTAILERYRNEIDMAAINDVIPGLMAGDAGAEQCFLDAWALYVKG